MSAIDKFYNQDDNYNSENDSKHDLPVDEKKFDYPKYDYNAIIKPKIQPVANTNAQKKIQVAATNVQDPSFQTTRGQDGSVRKPPVNPTSSPIVDPAFQTTRSPDGSVRKLAGNATAVTDPAFQTTRGTDSLVVQDYDQQLDSSIMPKPTKKAQAPPIMTKDGFFADPALQFKYDQEQDKIRRNNELQQNKNDNVNDSAYTDQQPDHKDRRTSFAPNTEDHESSIGASGHKKKKKKSQLVSQLSMRSFYTTYVETTIEPTDNFRDNLFDCFKNLWPSCGCVTLGGYSGCILPMYMVAQISNRIKWIDGRTVFGTYVILQILFFIIAFAVAISHTQGITNGTLLAVALQQSNTLFYVLFYVPSFMAIIFIIYLRCKFVEAFKIKEDWISTFFIGLFCTACSLCQMARHLWEYKNLLDGDGHMDGYMYYELDEMEDVRSKSFSESYRSRRQSMASSMNDSSEMIPGPVEEV